MELDPRQGDLFLSLINGGKKDEYPNFRSKINAVDSEGREKVDQEGGVPQGEETVVSGSQQSIG